MRTEQMEMEKAKMQDSGGLAAVSDMWGQSVMWPLTKPMISVATKVSEDKAAAAAG